MRDSISHLSQSYEVSVMKLVLLMLTMNYEHVYMYILFHGHLIKKGDVMP